MMLLPMADPAGPATAHRNGLLREAQNFSPSPRALFGGVLAIDFRAWVLALWLLIEPVSQG
jgi:hypothetical protein